MAACNHQDEVLSSTASGAKYHCPKMYEHVSRFTSSNLPGDAKNEVVLGPHLMVLVSRI
jgi:hypothetical protein